jgi:cellulose biosynthesis protein BcsQ
MKVLLLANLAGGVGKTTLAQSIATAASEYGKEVLAIDGDPDAALTFLSGIENPRFTLLEVATDAGKFDSAITKTLDRFSLLPSASRLIDLSGLSDAFTRDLTRFELVVIDSPSGPNRILPHLIEISDRVIAPSDGSMLSIRGGLHLRRFLERSANKPPLDLISNARRTLSVPTGDELKSLDTEIRFDEKVKEAQTSSRSTLSAFPDCDFSSDIREVTYSILEDFSLI